ncbi:MAG: permease, partial [Planctomycetota bacterium]|nr:permease [Planctomycetota bacterium]
GFGPVSRASLLGIPLPLCSCSVIPVAVELRRQGAGRGATAAFMVSTPETGVDSISSSVAVLHPLLVIFRPLAAMATAVATGLAIERFAPADPETGSSAVDCCDHDASDQVDGQSRGLLGGLRYAFDDLLGEIAPYLVPALLITAALGVFLEPSALSEFGVTPWLQRLVVLLAGIPVYVCATSATPVAAAMILAGISPGAALVFLLAGPATNLVTISAVRQNLGGKAAMWYILVVATLSYAFGTLLDYIWTTPDFRASPAAQLHGHQDLSVVHWAASVFLGALMLWHIGRKLRRRMTQAR